MLTQEEYEMLAGALDTIADGVEDAAIAARVRYLALQYRVVATVLGIRATVH